MPIYEYKCKNCGHVFEVMQKISDLPICTCPECSGPTNKVISPAGLMFKGSGWYITDYSSKGKSSEESTRDKGKKKKEETKEEKKNIEDQSPANPSNSST